MNRNNKNYAQAAAAQSKPNNNNTHHQNQQHHHQQVTQQNQTSGTSTSSNYSSSANGKAINKSQTKPQAQHNSTMGNGNTGRSTSIKQKNPVQLPTNGHAWEKKTLEFGSINTPNAQISSSTTTGPTLTSGGGLPTTLPTKGGPTFGTLSNTTTQTTQTTQATPTTVGTSGPGVNNNNNNSNSNSNNNNGVSLKPISTRAGEIPRTHSAPPQIQDNRNVGQPGYLSNVPAARTIHQQQSTVHQQPSASVSNPPLNHRKDSVSSTVSSNDGQPPFHPHHSPHHPNHTHNTHHHYGRHHNHNQKLNMGQPQNQYRPRDKNVTHQSPHLNPAQSVSTQGVPMAGPPQMWNAIYNRDVAYQMPFYAGYPVHHNPMFIPQHQYAMQPRPPPQMQQPQSHPHLTQVPTSYKPPNTATKQSRAIEIIDPTKNAPIQYVKQHQSQLSKSPLKREEAPPAVFDKKPEESDKEKPSSEDKGISKAVPIVDPAERERKEREEQDRITKEKEEQERKEREERERLEAERKEKEEKERIEREVREEQERIAKEKEKEEQERRAREEREREEKERLEKERLERERKEQEERERKEREEQERIAKEKEEQERKEREKREREEKERLEKERLERERKEQEERERKEREEQERIAKEKEEQERKEREEKERLEKERLEAERIEKEKKEKEEKEEKERIEAEEKTRKEQEEKEKEEIERKKKEEETKVAEDDEKKKEKEAESNDSKKEEKKYGKGHRPGPLDLSRTTSAPAIPSAPLSALGSARAIDDINSVQYPEGISSPNPALNSNAEPGKFKYDRSFLMQFMGVCKEKPENLPALEAIGMEEPKDDKRKTRPSVSRSNSSLHKNPQFAMGEFKFPPKTSEERFAVSNMRNGSPVIFGRALGRTGSGSTLLPAPGAMSASTPQSPSRSSSGRGTARKGGKGSHQVPMNMGEQVAPLERSENRWVPGQDHKTSEGFIPIESLQRKIKALLNKLTLEKFDSISDQIIEYANKSRDERDGRILKEVIRLIFEKSCDESNFCAMYAQLCRKMMERIDPEIVDENVKNTEGKFVQGGTLFRKYLLNRCQEDFEKGWKVNIPVPSNEKGEPDLLSDEYYVAAKAKRQGLGLIRFIGELFKLNMLTERIMHECIKKLLIYQGSPEEEEMESLCKLMNTVGEQLDHVKTNPQEHIKANQIDHAKAKQLMESYFNRLDEISKLPNLSSRIKFMIMDVIDLRSNAWKPRRDINAPKTIAEIHEDAAKQKEEAEFLRRSASSGGKLPKISEQMSRSGSGRRDHKGMNHGSSAGNDGWINVGGGSSQRKDKVGDLTKFGSVSRGKITGNNFSLAPGGLPLSGGAKGWKSDNKDRDDKTTVLSRTNSTSNMYSVLTAESSEGRKSSESSTSEIQKPSPPTERKRIILAPRTKNITTEESHASDKPAPRSNPEAVPSVQSMSNNELTKKINNMMEEYFSVLDIQEVLQCIKEIPSEHHAKAIESFANKVLEKKQKDVDNVMKLFKEIVSSETCDINTFKNGFKATLDFLMDIGADAPMSYSFTGQLLFSAGLDFRDITTLLIPLDDDISIEKIVKGYASALKNADEQKYVQKINEFDFKSLFPKKNKDEYFEVLGLESSKK